jgi:Na+-transporting NADH:ubiquinone oxidoreductase subunit B
MKIIKNFFDSQGKHFGKGGKLNKYYAIFEALETLFFMPKDTTQTGPNVRDSLDLKRFMSIVILALLPPLLFGFYNTGYQSNAALGLPTDVYTCFMKGLWIVLPLIIVSYAVGLFWEGVFAVVRGHNISEGFLVTGLLFPMILPPTIPLWQAAMGISFGVIIGKEIFGGTGKNILNPALTARAFLFFAYPGQISGDTVWTYLGRFSDKAVDTISGATPLAVAAATQAGSTIEAALDKAGFTFAHLAYGHYAACIGETSAVLCLVGAIILILTGVASYRVILGGVIGLLSIGYLLNFLAGDASLAWMSLDPTYHLVMGGFAFGITYMATDPVSGPGMKKAQWVYGFAIGALTIVIRVFNPAFPEGVMLAILFMNLFAALMDHIEIQTTMRKRLPNV